MKIGVIGAIGGAIARGWSAKGHTVCVAEAHADLIAMDRSLNPL